MTKNLRVAIIDPGATRTEMRARAFPGEDPQTVKTPDVVADRLRLADAEKVRVMEAIEAGVRFLRFNGKGSEYLRWEQMVELEPRALSAVTLCF